MYVNEIDKKKIKYYLSYLGTTCFYCRHCAHEHFLVFTAYSTTSQNKNLVQHIDD